MISAHSPRTSKELLSTVSSKGQVTVPIEIRRHLKVSPKDKIAFIINSAGEVTLSQAIYPDISSLKGAAGSLKKPMEWEEVKNIAYEDRTNREYDR